MIAVVDRHADRRVVIRAAAAAGKGGRLVHHDVAALRGEPHGGGEAGEAGADDVNCSAHHTRLRKHDEKELCLRQAHRRARRRKAARDQLLEDDVIGLAHDARRAHDAARTLRHDRLAPREIRSRPARRSARRLGRSPDAPAPSRGSVDGDAGRLQRLARQIEPAERGVLVEVAQDVGELQRAAEMMRERDAGVVLHAEHAHRKPADRAGDAVAIKIERRPVGRADVGDDVHLHAVDDGEEILALQVERAHRLRQARQAPAARAPR